MVRSENVSRTRRVRLAGTRRVPPTCRDQWSRSCRRPAGAGQRRRRFPEERACGVVVVHGGVFFAFATSFSQLCKGIQL